VSADLSAEAQRAKAEARRAKAEAIQTVAVGKILDCFASLAMTFMAA
jgi:hypothetical protein